MAKKKESQESNIVEEYLSASYILDKEQEIVKISPALDLILGGGIPSGTVTIISGLPKVGKTSMAMKILAKAQQQFGKIGVYVAVEGRHAGLVKNIKGTPGLDHSDDMFKIIASQKGAILSTENFFEKAEKCLDQYPGCCMIFDSFSDLSSSKEKLENYGDGYGVESRKLESAFSRRIAQSLAVNNSMLIGIAHLSQSLSMPGSTVKISRSMLHKLDVNLSLKKAYPNGDWIQSDRLIGQKVKTTCVTSALAGPGGECNLWLRYGQNFVDQAELAEMATDLSIISKAGAGWYSLPEKYNVKLQGFEKLTQFLIDNPLIYEEILTEVKGLLL